MSSCALSCASALGCFTLLSLQEEAKAAKEEGVPDEEGWVKVTRKGRKPGLPRTEAANLRVLEKEKQKRARKELLNFYAWQHREAKRERECASLLLPCLCLLFLTLWPEEHPSAFREGYVQLPVSNWLAGSGWPLATTCPSKGCWNILWEGCVGCGFPRGAYSVCIKAAIEGGN